VLDRVVDRVGRHVDGQPHAVAAELLDLRTHLAFLANTGFATDLLRPAGPSGILLRFD
jgi:hypothetical protein